MSEVREYLNAQEAAAALGVTRRRMWQMMKNGEIQAIPNPLDRREKLVPMTEVRRLERFVRVRRPIAGARGD